jgi:nucleoside-diphosphate-sugar epimerase
MRTALVLGAGGFIGNHLVNRLKQEGYWVRGADIKAPEYSKSAADNFYFGDLTKFENINVAFLPPFFPNGEPFDEVYQLAADMGGAGYIFSGENDANVMHNSALINLHTADLAVKTKAKKIFFSSSACMYPAHNQEDPNNPKCEESSAYPANPDSEYGWEKLFSERLYLAYARNFKLNVRIGRFHNIFGPLGSYDNGKEKAPAAVCRKVAAASSNGKIEIWGDGNQTRSFLYIDECLDGVRKLMDSDFSGPVNIGSDEMVTINQLVALVSGIAKKNISIKHINGPLGVRGRKSDNKLIKEKLNWAPSKPLQDGLAKTYIWIKSQVDNSK